MDAHNSETMFIAIAAVCFLACVAMAFKLRAANNQIAALASKFEADLTELRQEMQTASTQAADQSRRLAWIESRVRANAPAPRDNAGDGSAAKAGLTEYRHRVLSLARRGLDVNAIADMLGEPHGEIELIIGLSKAA